MQEPQLFVSKISICAHNAIFSLIIPPIHSPSFEIEFSHPPTFKNPCFYRNTRNETGNVNATIFSPKTYNFVAINHEKQKYINYQN
jgi:hypothetical protein